MKIIAKTIIGNEFLYSAKSARKVSAKSAEKILSVVNEHKSLLGLKENEIFHIYDVNEYDDAFYYAQKQSFIIRNGIVSAKNYF